MRETIYRTLPIIGKSVLFDMSKKGRYSKDKLYIQDTLEVV